MESKNSSATKNQKTHQLKGLHSEKKVIADLQSQGWELQFQRVKTSIAEIDLIFQKDGRVQLIEVKTLDNPWRSFERISHRQTQKLILNQIFISRHQNYFVVEASIAWVTKIGIEYLRLN